MVLESTMICFDNSDYQRNGDYFPSRIHAQKDGINLVCHTKLRSNPENNVGLLTLANTVEVLATLTSDVGRILSKMHLVQPTGNINLVTGVRIAHLVLKHRQGKNHKMRIVVFVGSPIKAEESDLTKLAKRLKKEKVNVDIVNFGDHEGNNELLTGFINVLNGKDGTGSHLITVPRGSALSEALISSPIIQGEDGLGAAGIGGAGFEFGVDPNEDPELALALRVSMEEQRQRQEEEQRRAQAASGEGGESSSAAAGASASVAEPHSEEALLERALAMSTEQPAASSAGASSAASAIPDFSNMSEEEQIAFAMQMSMQEAQEPAITQAAKKARKEETPMDVDEDYNEVITDPEFLQSVLENLPGVDPQSDAIRDVVGSLNKDKKGDKDKQQK
ncbi:26S proteasome non-ATPase regulatory subunit 4 [Culicoides brevitarsis]|uniref:26S proteasome non-ATPase regulatory subunit 4 n=1 Tax=Culicoides brevitarsis TaxID=469753 RepID=UPI00307BA74B